MHKNAIARNKNVVTRLQAQLQRGTTTISGGGPLTDKDITRINKELEVVQSRLTSPSKAK